METAPADSKQGTGWGTGGEMGTTEEAAGGVVGASRGMEVKVGVVDAMRGAKGKVGVIMATHGTREVL
jgi:hypothetical protein